MARRINIRQIEAFRAVMLAGTATQAAALMGITQPAVSRLIADLEAQVGFPLFSRQHGRLRAVPEAELLFQEVERAYVSLDHISNFLEGIHRSPGGNLRLLAALPIAHGILPEAIRRFRAEAPNTGLTVRTVIRRDIRSWLDAQQFDLAITNWPIDYPPGAREHLVRVSGMCVLPARHPLAERATIRATDLADQAFISMAPESQSRFKVDRVFHGMGVRRHLAIEAQTSMLICDLVASGLGVSVIDALSAGAAAVKGLVVRPFLPEVSYEFSLLHPLQRPRSQAARRFAEITRAYVLERGLGDAEIDGPAAKRSLQP